jgi:hypothetical protein
MDIISHRGFWISSFEKNQTVSFERSFSNGFGVETDLRDYMGQIVLSHDIADQNSILFKDFLKSMSKFDLTLPLALNVKSDGLQIKIKRELQNFGISNYFFFDMSLPDTLLYKKNDLTFYSRQSEFEILPYLYDDCTGIWLDAFFEEWYNVKTIQNHLNCNKKIAIVSSELHGRDHSALWNFLIKNQFHKNRNILLCTDFPTKAKLFFNNYI